MTLVRSFANRYGAPARLAPLTLAPLRRQPFGNLKAMLGAGFALRTLLKVKGEMALAVLAYNLKRAMSVPV